MHGSLFRGADRARSPSADVKRILLAYGVSGFISLAYQVAWFRILTDWFGSTNLTFALVVANFIGGLALGSLLSRRLADGLAAACGCTASRPTDASSSSWPSASA